ncbi:MAG TPA: hypothetical protein VEI54_13185 [Candidatus Limnocylindrales bacterium]|nr:hypothetical protein [Candidatus Limnocylindrales bacterium]
MTRCLDCGSERTSDQCPVCGLTSAAAEVLFRWRLLRQMAIFLAGSLLFPSLSQVYPPLDVDAMLVFFGLVFFLALALAVFLDRRAHARKEIELLKHLFTGLIPIPFILSLALFLNGRLDSPKDVRYHETVVEGRYLMRGVVRGTRRVFVYSWREGHKYERLAVDSDDYDRFQTGDRVNVGVGAGALGIPWFYGVFRATTSHDAPPANTSIGANTPKEAVRTPAQ